MWNVIQSNASPFGQPNDRGEVRYVGQETPTIQPVESPTRFPLGAQKNKNYSNLGFDSGKEKSAYRELLSPPPWGIWVIIPANPELPILVDDGNTIRELTYSEQETGTYLEDY